MCQFHKSERLNNYKLKQLLFKKGSSFTEYPFKVFWYVIDNEDNIYSSITHIRTSIPWDKHKKHQGKKHYDILGNPVPQSAVFKFPAKTICTVSSKSIKKASYRNRIKRLIKEAYRKNKKFFYSFLKKKNVNCLTAFVYIGKHCPTQEEVEKKLIVSLQFIIDKIEDNSKVTKTNNGDNCN